VLFGSSGFAYSYDNTAHAGYLQLGYDLGDVSHALSGLNLTAGYRYTWDKIKAMGSGFLLDPTSLAPTGCSNGRPVVPVNYTDCALTANQSSSAPNWTFGLDYMIEDHVLTYGKVSRGYKRGGFNVFAVNPDHLTFDPEYVTTYELGFKSTFRAGAIPFTFNADVFYSDYKNIQIAAGDYNPTTFSSGAAVFNAASAVIKGIEAEASVSPFHGLELSGNYSHLTGYYTDFSIQNAFGQFDCSGGIVTGTINLSCMPFSYLPKDQFSLSARYTLSLSGDLGKISGAVTYAYTGPQIETTTQLPQYEPGSVFPGFPLLNVTLNWDDIMKSHVDVGFFMTNVTDRTYRITNTGVFNSVGVQSNLYGEPRMYGFQLRYHW
jgi:iron complex outermembrane recepter protein